MENTLTKTKKREKGTSLLPDKKASIGRKILLLSIAYFLSRGGIFGIVCPFGISFYAVAERKGRFRILLLLTVALGIKSGGGGIWEILSLVLFYVASLIDGKWVHKNKLYTALFAAGSVVLPGLYFVFKSGGLAYDMLRLFLSASCTFIGIFLFSSALPILKTGKRRFFTQEECVCLSATLALIVLGIPSWSLYEIELKNILCVLLVLAFSLSKKPGIGALTGLTAGFILGFHRPDLFVYLGALGLAGMLSGLCAKYGKIGICLSFFLADMICGSYAATISQIPFSVSEQLLAFGLFGCLPLSWVARLGILQTKDKKTAENNKFKQATQERLHALAAAFIQLAESVSHLHCKKESVSDLSFCFDRVAEGVCKTCRCHNLCWQKQSNEMYDILTHAFQLLEEQGGLTQEDLPQHFQTRCVHLEPWIQSVNEFYRDYQNERMWKNRLQRSNHLMSNQFTHVSGVIDHIAQEMDENIVFCEELAFALLCALDKQGLHPVHAVIFKNAYGRFEVKLEIESCTNQTTCQKIIPIMNEILERNMEKASGDCRLKQCTLYFAETPRYRLDPTVLSAAKPGEPVCGDSSACLQLPDGNVLIAISDGKGSGKGARLQSQETIRLLTRMICAGFSPESAVRLTNTTLAGQMDEESFATLDLVLINTVTGYADFMKSGACSTFILRNRTVKRISSSSLPAGIIEEADIEHKQEVLQNDDWLILVSDGITEAFPDEQELISFIGKETHRGVSKQLAGKILQKARHLRKGNGDDMTIILGHFFQA